MENFTPVSAIIGGAMIGVASSMLLVLSGRLAGISGILAGLLPPRRGDMDWRILFIGGLLLGAVAYQVFAGEVYEVSFSLGWPAIVIGGLLTGIGTRVGSGCTSGHGVCGLGRLSPRSTAATITFIVAGGLTVFVVRHVVGG
ncbi:MAG: YeeE/YedE family protein [Proteobacteria bacterium]|nr:YeeE/YedE family protein [Pseudomonadota bacterium]MCH8187649.1 YeeE/YedE family protein [Pseudomonadota bacterium]